MRRQTSEFAVGAALQDALMGALTTRPAAALLDTPKIHLGTVAVGINRATVIGDLTEATFNGYAAQTFTPSALITFPDGTRAVVGQVLFEAGGAIADPGEVAMMYYVTDGAGAVLYGGEGFTDAVPFAAPGDFLTLDVYIPLPQLIPTNQEQ